jgi:hypothetical protein
MLLSSFHNYLSRIFQKKTVLDGRLIIIASLSLYFASIYIASFFVRRTYFWRQLGVPALNPLFGDLRLVIWGLECTRKSYDTAVLNSCDDSSGWFGYPRIWLTLSGLGLEQRHLIIAGIALALLFYLAILSLVGRLNYSEGILYSLFLCSPPIMLLIERGNMDILIFLLLSLSETILSFRTNLTIRTFAYILVIYSAFLKLLSVFSLAVILRERKKVSISLLIFFSSIFVLYYLMNIEDMQKISNAFIGNRGIAGEGFSFGYKVFLFKLKRIKEYTFNEDFFTLKLFSLKLEVFVIFLFFLWVLWFLIRVTSHFIKWLKHDIEIPVKAPVLSNHKYIDGFRIGSSIYLGAFLMGWSFDYRLVFWLFTIPQIIDWIKIDDEKLGYLSSFALLGILGSLYLSSSSFLGFDEILNWLLFGYFAYAFLLTISEWLKSEVHGKLAKFL